MLTIDFKRPPYAFRQMETKFLRKWYLLKYRFWYSINAGFHENRAICGNTLDYSGMNIQ
jgi:hypothetical protein